MILMKKLFLCDLTHVGPVISSEVFPYGIGMVGAYLHSHCESSWEIELFKFPNDLEQKLGEGPPDVIGFSNYSWNLNLSYGFIKRIKEVYPETLVVMGGPNYGLHDEEVERFWANHPSIDFYIVGEGEVSFKILLEEYVKCGSISAIKEGGLCIPGLHYAYRGLITRREPGPRLDLDDLPSPYLLGLMDKFWETSLIPLVATTRGCPFKCTMCAEGSDYYNKVKHNNKFYNEMYYIASHVRNTEILYLSDANFGMFKQDLEKAKVIVDAQRTFGYPKSIISATGKNRKENVIEVASMLNGALAVFASLQSTNENVLRFIKRDNIRIDSLSGVANRLNDNGGTVTELILGLPGDSLEAHIQSLRDTVQAGLGVVRNYQLIMLMQSELNSPASREEFGMRTKFRIMPRSLGKYKVLGRDFIAVESEEICMETHTLSERDQRTCRMIDLTVEIFHNGSPYFPYWKVINLLNGNWFDFLLELHSNLGVAHPNVRFVYEEFEEALQSGYFDSEEDLRNFVEENICDLTARTDGTNELSRAKARAFFQFSNEFHHFLHEHFMKSVRKLKQRESLSPEFFTDLYEFSKLQRSHILSPLEVTTRELNHDFSKLSTLSDSGDLNVIRHEGPRLYYFKYSPKQVSLIENYKSLYGTHSIDGLGRLLMRSRLTDMLRQVSSLESAPSLSNEQIEGGTESYFSYN